MTIFKGIFDNYRIKLLLSIVLINLCMVPVLVWNRLELIHKDIYERESRAVASIGRLLQNAMEDDLEDRDFAHLQKYLLIAKRQAMVAEVLVTDLSGRVQFSDNPGLVGSHTVLQDGGDITRTHGLIYTRVLPLEIRGIHTGYIRIDFSLAGVRREMREAFIWSFGLNGLWILLVCIGAFYASGKLFAPLAELKTVSRRIARGDFTARSTISSHDAVGELALAMNQMASQLSDLTSRMQEKIEYATAGLRISNEALQQKMLELEESNRKLMQLDALKSEFVSMVSHDLKTPLTSIIGFAKTLLSLDLTPVQRGKYLSIIEKEGKRLARLISEYLDISKIEAGKFNLNFGKVAIPALIEEIVQTIEVQHPGRLQVAVHDGMGTIDADKDRLKRAVLNIVDNALKYSAADEKVTVRVENKDEEVIISIEDRGIGVPKAEHDRIFDKFNRGVIDQNRYPGSGLGLTIAKAVVEAHRGSISIEDGLPKGSRFVIKIPVRMSRSVPA